MSELDRVDNDKMTALLNSLDTIENNNPNNGANRITNRAKVAIDYIQSSRDEVELKYLKNLINTQLTRI